ncbi:hypothetical protein NNRS527_02275 [Nitrosospira sp. NRS527]|nr:hypothetical protein NNRS527_02275 [Nitrosospira sp. NRS527]
MCLIVHHLISTQAKFINKPQIFSVNPIVGFGSHMAINAKAFAISEQADDYPFDKIADIPITLFFSAISMPSLIIN